MTYPIFGRAQPQPALEVERPKKRDAELGYKWAKFAKSFLRKSPFCAECGRRGRDVPAQALDHIIPRSMGGPMWKTENLQGLCAYCHSAKRELEQLALAAGNPQMLVIWTQRPETRPGRLAFNAIEP